MTFTGWEQRLTKARQHDVSCLLCEHRCGVDRAAGETGICKAVAQARVFRHRIESGEEPELVPSHLFYLSGCDLRCAFCIAGADAFDPRRGEILTSQYFSEALDWGQQRGAKTVQWVGGEPTIHLPRILEVMADCRSAINVVWKSDFHGTPETFALLDGIVETYVADFKFGNDFCAQRIARVDNYWNVLCRNLKIASGQGRLIVRHLLMPGHFDCCFLPVLRWLADELPEAALSLRTGYLPRWRAASIPELSRRLPQADAERARTMAISSGLEVIL